MSSSGETPPQADPRSSLLSCTQSPLTDSDASCCRFVENSGCPVPSKTLNLCGLTSGYRNQRDRYTEKLKNSVLCTVRRCACAARRRLESRVLLVQIIRLDVAPRPGAPSGLVGLRDCQQVCAHNSNGSSGRAELRSCGRNNLLTACKDNPHDCSPLCMLSKCVRSKQIQTKKNRWLSRLQVGCCLRTKFLETRF